MNRIPNFLNIAFRVLWRNKTYSMLNLGCLSFGLGCAIIALIYCLNLIGFDKFQENYNRLYSVNAYVTYFNGDRFKKDYLSASLPEILKQQAPEIEKITRLTQQERAFIFEDKSFTESGYYADASFFDVFTFPLIHSRGPLVLNDLNSIVISEMMALKFFGKTDCLDQTLLLKDENSQEAFKISGVFKNVPSQSTLRFDYILPFAKFLADNSWAFDSGSSACQTWILLKNKTHHQLVENKVKDLVKNQESTLNQELFLFPLKDMALYTYAGGKRVWQGMQDVFIAASIGLAILLIACFNFINLAIAFNMRRSSEVGIKKVVGSKRSMIVFQFMGETFLITFIGLIIAVMLIQLLLPEINTILNTHLTLNPLDYKILGFVSVILLFTVLASGLLPSLFLSSFNTLGILKGEVNSGNSYSIFRQSLIVVQFISPIVLIIIAMIIKTQDSYLRDYELGVNKDKLIIVENFNNVQKHAESIRADLQAIPGIDAVSFNNCIPTRGTRITNEVGWEGKEAAEKLHFWCIDADFDYNKVVKINLTEGRYFNPAFTTDSANYLVNDIALNAMKNKCSLGSTITLDGRKGTIIGIFKDFHAIDLAGPQVPVIIRISSPNRYLMVQYSSANFSTISKKIESVFKQYGSDSPIQITLFRDLYPINDLSIPSKFVVLSFFIALLLACAGLFGLVSFTTESRTKEIGIRKVNGASTFYIMRLLLISYTKCLLISFLIALPIAFFLGESFLARFHFHTPVPLFVFLAGPSIVAIIALSTVSFHTWKAVLKNPVESLRYE